MVAILHINQILNITIRQNNQSQLFLSRIADIQEEALIIEFPLSLEKEWDPVIFHPGTKLKIDLIHQNSRFQFTSEINGKTEDKIPLLLLKRPSEADIEKIQLRQNFRVPANIDMQIVQDGENSTFYTIDVSAGGLSFYDKTCSFKKGDRVAGILELPFRTEKYEVSFLAKIVRVVAQNSNIKIKKTAIQFTDIEEKDRRKIIQFCFKRQLELKEKGISYPY